MMHASTRFASLALVVSLVGCSGSKGPATAKVSGVVKHNGAPVDGATIVFSPVAGGRPATAVSDSQGHYDLSTYGDKDGAVPGDYKITVEKTKTEGETPNLTYEQINDMQQRGEPVPGPVTKNLLPEKYISPATTDLSATVKSGTNDVPLDLKD